MTLIKDLIKIADHVEKASFVLQYDYPQLGQFFGKAARERNVVLLSFD